MEKKKHVSAWKKLSQNIHSASDTRMMISFRIVQKFLTHKFSWEMLLFSLLNKSLEREIRSRLTYRKNSSTLCVNHKSTLLSVLPCSSIFLFRNVTLFRNFLSTVIRFHSRSSEFFSIFLRLEQLKRGKRKPGEVLRRKPCVSSSITV